jgi:hypothetical protein
MWIVALQLDGGAVSPRTLSAAVLSAVFSGLGSGMALLGSQVLPAKGTKQYRS